MYPRFGTEKTDMRSEIGKRREIIYLKLTITLAVFRCSCFAAIEKKRLATFRSLFPLWDDHAKRTDGRAGKSPAAWKRDPCVTTP